MLKGFEVIFNEIIENFVQFLKIQKKIINCKKLIFLLLDHKTTYDLNELFYIPRFHDCDY